MAVTSKKSGGRTAVAPVASTPAHTGWPSAARVVRLSDPDMASKMAELKQRIESEPGFGRSLLQQAGIVTAKGKLTKIYGGR